MLLQFKTTVFYFNIFWNVIYSCDGKAGNISVSHDPSEIQYANLVLKKHFALLMLKTFVRFNIFVETVILFTGCEKVNSLLFFFLSI